MIDTVKKNNILIVSNTFPAHDTNAGDWRIYCLCRELAVQHTVYFLSLAFLWDGFRYIDDLRKLGVRIVQPGYKNIYDFPHLLKCGKFQAIIFEWFDTAQHFIKYFPLCQNVIIDTHELFYLKESRRNAIQGTLNSSNNQRETKKKELDVYRLADTLIAISEEEKIVLHKELPRKKIIVVPTWCHIPPKTQQVPFENRKDIVFFASFYNSEQVDAVKYFIEQCMPLLRAKLPDVVFHIAGDRSSIINDLLTSGQYRKNIFIDGRVGDINSYLSRFRVFICPLRYGAGLKKKILDAVVAGCPIVSTRRGLDGINLVSGKDVLIGAGPNDIIKKICMAYSDKELWLALSHNSLEKIKKYYPYGKGLKQLEECLTGRQDHAL